MLANNLVVVATALLPTAWCVARPYAAGASFKLYAYGKGIGGLEVFFDNGAAHLANFLNASAPKPNSAAVRINFTASADGIWTVAPNRPSADLPGPPFQNATFYVPTAANATSRACGFAPGPAPQLPPATTASHWRFYGSVAVTSALQAFFFAEPVADEPAGVYALVWNATTAAAVPVVLKDAPPANDWRV